MVRVARYADNLGSSPRVRGKPRRAGGGFPPVRLIPACAGKTSCLSNWLISNAAHPRVCGENAPSLDALTVNAGSSPRVRGKRTRSRSVAYRARLIPACAGKTSAPGGLRASPGAHPRACGENASALGTPAADFGSSPRVRGKPSDRRRSQGLRGLIPARAGKTATSQGSSVLRPAHPRACGENVVGESVELYRPGSSPRVRGKPETRSYPPSTPRLIPARAGKTGKPSALIAPPPAHPRACGENPDKQRHSAGRTGSSPRVRGKRAFDPRPGNWRGLIPARAGKTAPVKSLARSRRAHPRACGENVSNTYWMAVHVGSSPRVRGKLLELGAEDDGKGLIPARAGKTSRSYRGPWKRWAHPRACGENWIVDLADFGLAGSSPRVRGKPFPSLIDSLHSGLIPARAGKTRARPPTWCRCPAHPRACGENSMLWTV